MSVKELEIGVDEAKKILEFLKLLDRLELGHASIIEQIEAYESNNERIHTALAKSPNLPDQLCLKLANSSNWYVLLALSSNMNTQSESLDIMSFNENVIIRSTCARHPNFRLDSIKRLALDHDAYVRRGVKLNPHTPKELIEEMNETNS